jgi:RHS repeat-associated protein
MTYSTTKFTYDKTGNLTRILTPKGHEIRREYDKTNRLVAEYHVEKGGEIKNQTSFIYDKAGNLIKVTDNNGQAITYEYDLLNRETKRVLKNGGIQQKVYDKNGRVVRIIRPNEYAKSGEQAQGYQYEYDILGRILTITAPDSTIVTSNAYNEAGELIKQTDASGYGIHTTYDFAGRRKKITTDGNSSQEYEYDASGNIIGVLDGNLTKTCYEVDSWGRVTAVNMPEGTKESYTYDYAGNITATIDGEGNTLSYTYNALGKVAKIKDQAGTEETFFYDPEGNLREYTDRNQNTLLYTFNLYGNLTGKRVKDGTLAEAFGYHADGTLKYATSQGMRYDYSYYPDGSLKEKKASGRTLLHYTYDLNGNKTSQTDFTGKTTRYQYDVLDRLEEVYDNGRKQAGYTYYPDGSIKELQVGESLITSYTYDADKNLTGLRTTLAGETLVENQYTFDHNGNCQKKQGLGGITSYTYDSKNQLVQAAYPTYTEELYYDRAGNRTKRTAKGLEELYQYDERNRLTEQRIQDQTTGATQEVNAFTYDLQGNLLKDAKAEYTYDGFNRMVKAETAEGNVQVNRYDAEGLRSEIEENGKLVQFLYSGRDVVAETKEDESVVRHIRGYSLISSDSEKAKTYYHYASDELGSITHITNEEQEILNQYEYDAFGNVIASKEQIENRFRFCGEQYDQVTGQYYLRARYYNPVIARFTQEDTYRGDGLNLYAYCANNPVRYYDPSGNDKTDVNNKYSGDQKALKDLVDEVNERGGATPDEIRILNEWANEYGVPPKDLDIKKQLLLPGPAEAPKPDVPSSRNSQGGSDVEGAGRLPTEAELNVAIKEWSEYQKSFQDVSNRKKNGFNTATVVYDAKTGKYYYGMNKGVAYSGDTKNPILFGNGKESGLLPKESLNDYQIGNCAEVDAVNQALNDNSNISDLYMYTISTGKYDYGSLKTACKNCTKTFRGNIAKNYSGWKE